VGGAGDSTRPAVVKPSQLESMDHLDECWASSTADHVDYSQRIVFSDEEDFTENRSVDFLPSAAVAASAYLNMLPGQFFPGFHPG